MLVELSSLSFCATIAGIQQTLKAPHIRSLVEGVIACDELTSVASKSMYHAMRCNLFKSRSRRECIAQGQRFGPLRRPAYGVVGSYAWCIWWTVWGRWDPRLGLCVYGACKKDPCEQPVPACTCASEAYAEENWGYPPLYAALYCPY